MTEVEGQFQACLRDAERTLREEQARQQKYECARCFKAEAEIVNSVSGHQNGHDIDLDCFRCAACGCEWAE